MIIKGVPGSALSLEQLAIMDMQYEDRDGDMLALTAASDFADLVNEAQAIFVSRRTKKAGTRLNAGPRQLGMAPEVGAVSLPSSPPEDSLTLIPL